MTDSPKAAEELVCQTYPRDDLIDFIEGSTPLATGGGGATQIARNMLDASGITGVTAVALDQAADDVPAAMVAEVFAPSALWAFQDYRSAFNSFAQSVGRGLVLSGEVGAVNGIVPAIVAALTGSHLLKCSTSDRSLPEMDMTLFENTIGLGLDTESAGVANSERIFGYANMAGKAMQYAPAANHGTRPPLTVNWPAMPAQK